MTHNPFQSYQTDPTWGAFAGMANPYGTPFTGMQAAGIPAYGNIPSQPLQLASLLSSQNPFQQYGSPNLAALYQNPYAIAALQNPLVAQQLAAQGYQMQNPLLNPILAQQLASQAYQTQNPLLQNPQLQQNPFQQNPFQQNPFQQHGGLGSPFAQFGQGGSPLAPQSWVGQQGLPGQGFGQINPLVAQQLAARLHSQSGSPWGF